MRSTLPAILLACGVSLLACHDSAESPTEPLVSNFKAAGGSKDRVHGRGIMAIIGDGFEVNAQSGPLGEDPKGFLSLTGSVPLDKTRVTCMTVVGNRAVVGAPDPARPDEETGELHGAYLGVEDNSDLPGDVPDRAIQFVGPPPSQAKCDAVFHIMGLPTTFLWPLEEGDVKVHDALLPAL